MCARREGGERREEKGTQVKVHSNKNPKTTKTDVGGEGGGLVKGPAERMKSGRKLHKGSQRKQVFSQLCHFPCNIHTFVIINSFT